MENSPQISDQKYLLHEQYKDSSSLQSRLQGLQQMGLDFTESYRWLFDHLPQEPRLYILELGCGHGLFWQENRDRIPPDWKIVVSDFSAGMLEEAQAKLKDIRRAFEFHIVDAQQIPYRDGLFDCVIANNMLYHIPNLSRALSEIQRVLRPGGQCFATTIGQNVVDMFARLMQSAQAEQSESRDDGFKFTLTSGESLLAGYFPHVTLERLDRQVDIPDAGLLSAMLSSFTHMDASSKHDDDARPQKALSFTFEYGLFIATNQASTRE